MDKSSIQALSEIILPPGSTSSDLQTAVDGAASGDTIILSGDMPFTDTVTIPEDKDITIQSGSGNNWTMLQSDSFLLFKVTGSLTLNNITLDGGNAGRGVEVRDIGSFTINDGVFIKNCTQSGVYVANVGTFNMTGGIISDNINDNDSGGGVSFISNGTFNMTGGSIRNNTADTGGGGVFLMGYNSRLNMTGGTISGNNSGVYGGGVFIENGTLTMTGGTISGNKCEGYGGGVLGIDNSNVIIKNASITENTAVILGGGIYIGDSNLTVENGEISGNEIMGNGGGIFYNFFYDSGKVEITGKSYITNNIALLGSGGGISTYDPAYGKLITGVDTVFGCNRASAAYAPPENAAELYPDIQFASTTITDHPLNNFDIYHIEGEPIIITYNVTYDANGGTGSYIGSDIEPGGMDTVLSPDDTEISREGYVFTTWNTQPDGSGTKYNQGDSIILNCNVTLYAQWTDAPIYTVTYRSNGGIGGFVDPGRQYGTNYTIMTAIQAGITRLGYSFTGWNTEPDGSGMSYAPGDIVTITGDMRLYAQWRQNPSGKPKRLCPKPVTKCRRAIEGQKIWVDNENTGNKRPDEIEIVLLRDGEEYDRTIADAASDWAFGFCCVPVWKNTGTLYRYEIDEPDVPAGYTKTIEGYNVKNTLNP